MVVDAGDGAIGMEPRRRSSRRARRIWRTKKDSSGFAWQGGPGVAPGIRGAARLIQRVV